MRPVDGPIDFIYIGDVHLSPIQPRRRTDDYYQEVLGLMGQVHDLCVEHECPLVIGGDLGHRPIWVGEMLDDLWAEIPLGSISVPGNHDLPGRSAEDFRRCGLYNLCVTVGVGPLLVSPSFKKRLHPKLQPKVETFIPIGDPIQYALIGIDASIPDDPKSLYAETERAIKEIPEDWPIIGIYHQPVGPGQSEFWMDYQTLELPERVRIALFSDIHIPFGPWTSKTGAIYANPGPIGRRNVEEASVMPAVALVCLSGDKPTVKFHQLKAKPGNLIFDLETAAKVREERKKTLDIGRYIRAKEQERNLEFKIREIGKVGNYSQESIELFVERVNDVKRKA